MKKAILQLLLIFTCLQAFSQTTTIKYLSGTDKDHTVQWDFYCTAGRKSGQWTKIAVPSNWEQQGFGSYNYGHDKGKANERGMYKHEFDSGKWKGKKIFIVFEGSMTDTEVKINGKLAGPVHQGAFYRFKYDITDLLKSSGKNLLEVTVDKTSANSSVNSAERTSDFWVFGGIFRPVYLEVVPETFIARTAVNAKADGSFQLDVYPVNIKGDETIEVQLQKSGGQNFSKPIAAKVSGEDKVRLTGNFSNPELWSAEFPNLYRAIVRIKSKQGKVVHQIIQKFGFRTIELRRNDGFYINGAKVILKGNNRHSFWPESGRTLSHDIHLMDVKLMKEMNMNAVRMSHYPPDVDFLHICDSLGLYVIDELTGWQAKYDTNVGRKLVKELVVRDVNHPSVILWANGNEGGWNTELDKDYALYDPQERVVIHPWEKFNGTNTKHYPDYNYMVKSAASEQDVFLPTEFMHGLYDGGAGAALDDFWNVMLKHPRGAGGFIWAFADEAIIRTDKNGSYDTDGNHGADGIVGPHREKEASFYTIKEIWSPVHLPDFAIKAGFNGKVTVENRYSFANLSQCSFKWQLVKLPGATSPSTKPKINSSGILASIDVKPGSTGMLDLKLPASWDKNDALYLTAYGPDKKEIFTWSWSIPKTATVPTLTKVSSKPAITVEEEGQSLLVKCDGINYYFDKITGYIQKVQKPASTVSLSGGPVLAGVQTKLTKFTHIKSGENYLVEAVYEGADSLQVNWTFSPGIPVKLEYTYTQTKDAGFRGITFNYPEEKITGMKWLGRGPYRAWKNRLKGQQLGVWQKAYNNTITGETWGFPEFKGYHSEVSWVNIENKESTFTVYTPNENMYFQMLRPDREMAALKSNNVEPAFPEGNIGFLSHINAIGTKFQSANVMGPQSQPNSGSSQSVKGILFFDFSY